MPLDIFGAMRECYPVETTQLAGDQDGAVHVLPPGTVLGQYELVRMLGSGGMAVVYEAVHTGLQKRVALKTLHLDFAAQAIARARFESEARAAANLAHPNVVAVTDFGVDLATDTAYLVMELLKGESLAQRLRRGAMSEAVALSVVLPILAGLAAAHRAGIIHRDLKPENIFLSEAEGQRMVPKIIDFGISKRADSAETSANLTMTGQVFGTPYYMSPEQTRGSKDVDGRVDQFAVGVILYECVTGRRPFAGDSTYDILNAIVCHEPPPCDSLGTGISQGFAAVVQRAIAKEPAQRFDSVSAMAMALWAFADPRTRAQVEQDFLSPSDAEIAPTVATNAPHSKAVRSAAPPPVGASRARRRGVMGLVTVGVLGGVLAWMVQRERSGDRVTDAIERKIRATVDKVLSRPPEVVDKPNPTRTTVEKLPPPDRHGFAVLLEDHVWDLRRTKRVPRAVIGAEGSAAVLRNTFRVRKTAEVSTFATTVRTKGTEIFVKNLSAYPLNVFAVQAPRIVGDESLVERQKHYDVSGVPVGGEFVITDLNTYWNSAQSADDRWVGFVGREGQEETSILVIFPDDLPYSDFWATAAVNERDVRIEPAEYDGDNYYFLADEEGRRWLYWHVFKPEAGYVYQLRWSV